MGYNCQQGLDGNGKLMSQYDNYGRMAAAGVTEILQNGRYTSQKEAEQHVPNDVAKKLFGKLHVQFYFLEFDSPRAGGFEPLREVPDNKMIFLAPYQVLLKYVY